MEHPLLLVGNSNGSLELNQAALETLRAFDLPMVVVAVTGPTRSGKSYLLNRLAGSRMGFSLGHTVQSHTKGIWMWCLAHPQKTDQHLLLLDCEGIGDPEKGDEQNDNSIMALAVLLCSLFVYNSKDVIQQASLRDLHFVTELAKLIRVKSQGQDNQEPEFDEIFPDFVWTLRDLTTDLEIDGLAVSSDEYLENCLKLRPDSAEATEKTQDYNSLRKCLREYFPSRCCFGFGCPAARRKLKRLQELPDTEVDEDFVKEFGRFSEYVYTEGKVKRVLGGHHVTGTMLCGLLEGYVRDFVREDIPCVESSVARMAELKNETAVSKALERYDDLAAAQSAEPSQNLVSLARSYHHNHKEALQTFMRHSLMDKSGKHLAKLEAALDSRYREQVSKMESDSERRCKALISETMGSLQEKLRSQHYVKVGGHAEFQQDLMMCIEEYNARSVGEFNPGQVLSSFLESLKPQSQSLQTVESFASERKGQLAELTERITELRNEFRAKELERDAAERARREDLFTQLEAKFEMERALRMREQEEAIRHREEEVARYFREGHLQDSSRLEAARMNLSTEYTRTKNLSFWQYIILNFLTFGMEIVELVCDFLEKI